jgi:Universal stress protein UspA and related nucleotide-binding proteins
MNMPIQHDSRVIVVGVDGSTGSLRAMRWAISEAALRGCAIEAVTVWRAGSYGADTRQAAEELRAQVVRDACTDLTDGPPISEETETGSPEEVLVARSRGASLLVIGSHGVGSIRHAALGSTSEYCSRMAACPVVVLPTPAGDARHAELAGR